MIWRLSFWRRIWRDAGLGARQQEIAFLGIGAERGGGFELAAGFGQASGAVEEIAALSTNTQERNFLLSRAQACITPDPSPE